MIRVRSVGHIRTSLGRDVVELDEKTITSGAMIEKLRAIAGGDPRLGFTKVNTLIVVNGGEAFSAAEDRALKDGDEVLLLPFSHGG